MLATCGTVIVNTKENIWFYVSKDKSYQYMPQGFSLTKIEKTSLSWVVPSSEFELKLSWVEVKLNWISLKIVLN